MSVAENDKAPWARVWVKDKNILKYKFCALVATNGDFGPMLYSNTMWPVCAPHPLISSSVIGI